MKNIFKTFSIIAVVALVAFSFTACSDEDPGSDGVNKTLVITGINAETGLITAGITDGGTSKTSLVAYSQVPYATDVTIPLLSAKNRGDYYTGTGSYYILIIFDGPTTADTDDVAYIYSDGTTQAVKYNITAETTTIEFSKFQKVTSSGN